MSLGVRDHGGDEGNIEKERPPELQEECETCVICSTKFNSSVPPKLLPCLHAVCKACITSGDDGNGKECPVCGLSFNLSEVTDCFMFVNTAPKCGGCDESVLSGWCVQCEEALCSQCVTAHQRVKVTRSHTVTRQDPSPGLAASLRCTSHKQEWLKFLCITCNELTCRDCQLILHRGHSFLLLDEAVVSLRDQLQKMLHSIEEQRNSMKESLLNMDGRLQDLKVLKVASKKKLSDLVRSMYVTLVSRSRELFKEVEGLYDEEEKNLLEMKTNLRKLEERQEYVTAFIHKILKTDSQFILLHKKQIEKQVEGLLSQRKCLTETVIQPTLQLRDDFCKMIKTFGSINVRRVPLDSRRKCWNSNKHKEAPKQGGNGPSGINSKPVAVPGVFGRGSSQPPSDPDLPCCVVSGETSLKPEPFPRQPSPLLAAPDSVRPEAENQASTSSHLTRPAPLLHPRSTATPSAAARVGPAPPHPASSDPPSAESARSLRVLSLPLTSMICPAPTSFPSHTSLDPRTASLDPQAGSIPAALPLGPSAHPPTVPRSIDLHVASAQFLVLNQTRSNSAPSLSTPAPPARPSQAASNPQPAHGKVLSDWKQHGVQLIQSAPIHSSSVQPFQSNSSLPSVSNGALPLTLAPANTLPVHLQSTEAVAQSYPLLFSLLKEPDGASCKSKGTWKFHYYIPVPAANPSMGASCAPNCTPPLMPAPSDPGVVPASTSSFANGPPAFRDIMTSWQPLSGGAACSALPVDSKFIDLPVTNSNEPTQTMSIMPALNALQTPSGSSNQRQSQHVAQKCEVPVKAPADSLGEGSVSVGGRASPADEDPDGNLPTSTVSEADANKAPPSSYLLDAPFIGSTQDCPSDQSSLSPATMVVKSVPVHTSTENTPITNTKSLAFPVSFPQILDQTASVTSPVDGLPPAVALPRSGKEQEGEEEDEEDTDISDSEPVEEVYEGFKPEGTSQLTANTNRSLSVSLPRLPISFPASGSPLPQFRIVASDQTTELLLKELQDGEPTQRSFRIPALPTDISLLESSGLDCPLLEEMLDCAVCLSSGALFLCAECGRGFHSECHVPPVLKPSLSCSDVWMCSLCHNVFDDTDPFRHSRLKEPYLGIQDQRRCEQLLLTLMCEEHSYLLYRRAKHYRRCVAFEFIVGRLLGKHSPPYRSAAELVSDLWALFDVLFSISKKKELVLKLQRSFQERLNITFGGSLHASLLKPPSSDDQKVAPETDLDKNKAKNTLKRMKAFFSTNSFAKKPRVESPNKD